MADVGTPLDGGNEAEESQCDTLPCSGMRFAIFVTSAHPSYGRSRLCLLITCVVLGLGLERLN